MVVEPLSSVKQQTLLSISEKLSANKKERGYQNFGSRAISEGPGLRGLSSGVKQVLLADE